ncbi:MAG TPA: amino acid adenylation domain-containing protein [Stellaceae bacterium]
MVLLAAPRGNSVGTFGRSRDPTAYGVTWRLRRRDTATGRARPVPWWASHTHLLQSGYALIDPKSNDRRHRRGMGKGRLNCNLALFVHRHSLAAPERPALCANGETLSYRELARRARNVAGALRDVGVQPGARVAILASRSVAAYAGMLGASWVGAAYMPINLSVPERRLIEVLDIAKPAALVADETGTELLSNRVMEAAPPLVLTAHEDAKCGCAPRQHQQVRAMSTLDEVGPAYEPAFVGPGDMAYLMFTSGSTGAPKGVMVPSGAVHHYLSCVRARYPLTPDDRVAAPTDLSFDLSVNDMFLAWDSGASLHVVPAAQAMAPGKFIKERAMTAWLSVPSVIGMMRRVKMLRPASFPSLRYSLFCGEPLPLSAAQAWQEAAPNSIVDNLYGPTEATVACLWEAVGTAPPVTPERAIIAIGRPFPGMAAAIVEPTAPNRFLAPGERGELALSGPQLALGYFGAPELTAKRFPSIDGKRWYLTGDMAYQDADQRFHHLGRIDNQVKVNGYRVELEEVEAHLRAVCSTELVAAVAWPVAHGSATGIVGFHVSKTLTPEVVRDELARRIPAYMMPNRIHVVGALPLNANGKVDRHALIAQLNSGES